MRYKTTISIAAALILATSSGMLAAQGKGGGAGASRPEQASTMQERGRLETREQERLAVAARKKERVHEGSAAGISDKAMYGSELMTPKERAQYRQELAETKSAEAREEMQLRHEERMRERALQQGKDLVPPGQGPVYGGAIMTVQERNAYREQLRHFDSEQDRLKFQAQHREMMNQRAAAMGIKLEEAE